MGADKYLLDFLKQSSVPVREKVIQRDQNTVLLNPFTSARKIVSRAVRMEDGSVKVYVKGAPERVLSKCTHYIDAEGRKEMDGGDVMDRIYE